MARIITVFSHNSNGSGFATLAGGELIEFGGAGVVPFSAWCRAAGVSTAGYLSYWSRLGYEVR